MNEQHAGRFFHGVESMIARARMTLDVFDRSARKTDDLLRLFGYDVTTPELRQVFAYLGNLVSDAEQRYRDESGEPGSSSGEEGGGG